MTSNISPNNQFYIDFVFDHHLPYGEAVSEKVVREAKKSFQEKHPNETFNRETFLKAYSERQLIRQLNISHGIVRIKD